MKIKIGKYINWVGPYQIASALFFWVPKDVDEFGFKQKKTWIHNLGYFLSHRKWPEKNPKIRRLEADHETWLLKLCQWIHNKRDRKIKIKIDYYDTWNAFHTLALVIHPTLVEFKKVMNSTGMVDDEDVPEHIRSTADPTEREKWETDKFTEARWHYVLDEMIWAFAHIIDDSWESQFYSGESDIYFERESEDSQYRVMKHGKNDTFEVDYEGIEAMNARINNGLRLFGKYFRSLWD